jgi:hypothetical protein
MIKPAKRCRLLGWALRYADEVWWSWLKQPRLHSWSEMGQPQRLLELEANPDDSDPKALRYYGVLEPERKQVQVRAVSGRPVSHVTAAFMDWQSIAEPPSRTASRRRDLG